MLEIDPRPRQNLRSICPHDAAIDKQRPVFAVLEEHRGSTRESDPVELGNKGLQGSPLNEGRAEAADVGKCRYAQGSSGKRAVDIRLDRIAEIRGGPKLPQERAIFQHEPEVRERVQALPVDLDRDALDTQVTHPGVGRGVRRSDDRRVIACRLKRPHEALAEIGDIPVAVRGKDDGPGRGRLRQALSRWKRGISTSNALPSSSTMR